MNMKTSVVTYVTKYAAIRALLKDKTMMYPMSALHLRKTTFLKKNMGYCVLEDALKIA